MKCFWDERQRAHAPAGEFFSGSTITVDGARDNWFGTWPPDAAQEGGKPLAEQRRPKPGSA